MSMEQRGREAYEVEMRNTVGVDTTEADPPSTDMQFNDRSEITEDDRIVAEDNELDDSSNNRNDPTPANFGMTVSADHGWQKRGFDSLTGHTFLMSNRKYGNKVVKAVVKHRTCATCKWWQRNRPGRKPRPHRCVWNHRGFARLMEAQAGIAAVKEIMEQGTPVKTIEGDGDTTLVSRLKSELGVTVEKKLDKNHCIKNIVSKFYGPQKNDKGVRISNQVIKHLSKSLKYVFSKNQGNPEDMRDNFKALVPHQFGDHSPCQPRFCGYKRTPEIKYIHRGLPYKVPLTDCMSKLQEIFEPVIAKSLIYSNLGSSQACEHAHRAASLRAPKHLHYGESESLDFRVKATAACINEGRSYLSEVENVFTFLHFFPVAKKAMHLSICL